MKTISDCRNRIERTEYAPEVKKALLDYMNRRQFLDAASTGRITDWVTGEPVDNVCYLKYKDGEFEWISQEIYLLDKYNLKLEDEFVRHVIENT